MNPERRRRTTTEARRRLGPQKVSERRAYRVLVERHWQVNHKRVHRLWKGENMRVPGKQHRRQRFSGGGERSCVPDRTGRLSTTVSQTSQPGCFP